MVKTLKWVYKLGVMHERRRIKLLIAQHRSDKPDLSGTGLKSEDNYYRQLHLWNAVGTELDNLTNPPNYTFNEVVPQLAPIDED